jgi:hypothetical protein
MYFWHLYDELVDNCCDEECLLVAPSTVAREKEAGGQKFRLVTEFGNDLLNCQLSSSCQSV